MDRKAEMKRLRFEERWSLRDIGEKFGITGERVRQLTGPNDGKYSHSREFAARMKPRRLTREESDAAKIAKFWNTGEVTEDGCWEWAGYYNAKNGYGTKTMRTVVGMESYAHRIAWILANGPIPRSLFVLHKCDNRKCINPAHLYLGTQTQNIRDREERWRGYKRFGKNKQLPPRRSIEMEAVR